MERLTGDYLSWSGLAGGSCLDLLACSYAADSSAVAGDREVVSIVLYNLMTSRVVEAPLKARLRSAARAGRRDGSCAHLPCSPETE